MKTTLTVDNALLVKAVGLTGIEDRSALVREALTAQIARESARQLARLAGSEPELGPIRRRRAAATRLGGTPR